MRFCARKFNKVQKTASKKTQLRTSKTTFKLAEKLHDDKSLKEGAPSGAVGANRGAPQAEIFFKPIKGKAKKSKKAKKEGRPPLHRPAFFFCFFAFLLFFALPLITNTTRFHEPLAPFACTRRQT